jgi:hypothetical protein
MQLADFLEKYAVMNEAERLFVRLVFYPVLGDHGLDFLNPQYSFTDTAGHRVPDVVGRVTPCAPSWCIRTHSLAIGGGQRTDRPTVPPLKIAQPFMAGICCPQFFPSPVRDERTALPSLGGTFEFD